MAAPTPEAIENARRKVEQAKARLQALEARAATLNRKQDARRKIILGGLLLDAAMKDPAWESRLNDLMGRISRDQDRKAFDGWTFKGGPADRSEEHTSELQSLMRISYAVFCLKKKKKKREQKTKLDTRIRIKSNVMHQQTKSIITIVMTNIQSNIKQSIEVDI